MSPGAAHDDNDETPFRDPESDIGEDESLESALAREERWEELAALFVGRAEAAADPTERAQNLARAALLFESKLEDPDKSFLILETAFQEDLTNEAVAHELARVTTALGRWPALIASCRELALSLPAERRVQLMLALAVFQEQNLRDTGGAEQSLATAVALDGRNIRALKEMARLASRRGNWAGAVDNLLQAAGATDDSLEKVRLHLEAAAMLETRLDDRRGAAKHYKRALILSPGNALAAEALARLGIKPEEIAADAPSNTPAVERKPGGSAPAIDPSLSPAERADAALAIAEDALEREEPAEARDALVLGLEAVPDHRGCREAMLEACLALGDMASAAHHRKALLVLLDSDEERFDWLLDIARRLRDDHDDPDGAIELYEQALELEPDHHEALHEALELVTERKQWKSAVQILSKLAALATGRERARYLVASGNILNYELHAADEAVAVYNDALDEDPDDFKTFERIDRILSGKRAWKDEARNFRSMIKRLGPTPPPEKQAIALTLWKGLGEIYRSRLKDDTAAVAAFEVCASLDPEGPANQEILAELFERQGATSKALEKRAWLLGRAEAMDEMTRHIRAILRLHSASQQPDRIWCACAALVACGVAEPSEKDCYEREAQRRIPMPRGGMNEEMWQRAVYHAREDRRVSQVFAVVSPSVAMVRAKEPRGFGLDERQRIADSDTSLMPALVSYASAVLGVGRPSLYVFADRPGGLDLANTVEQGQLHPSLVIGATLARPRSEREVLFAVARAIGLLRFEHLVLWPHVVPTQAELRVVLLAVLKLCRPSLDLREARDVDQSALKRYAALFERTLPPHVLESLGSAFPSSLEDALALDVGGWVSAAYLTANRAGLLVCGDLLSAIRMVQEVGLPPGVTAEEAIADLVRWSVSPQHLALREQLGLGVEGQRASSRVV